MAYRKRRTEHPRPNSGIDPKEDPITKGPREDLKEEDSITEDPKEDPITEDLKENPITEYISTVLFIRQKLTF